MLDNNTRTVLSAALDLPEAQQFQLIDALLGRSEEPESFHADAPPLSNDRLQELVQEGKDAIAKGDSKTFQTPRAMANHIGEIFDQAILDNAKIDSQE
ncbi:MAG: hypothetical protein GXP28_00575 [Planctomycetes bacterium]|nr:hypothetical protein [Planctomycetota bacterium]